MKYTSKYASVSLYESAISRQLLFGIALMLLIFSATPAFAKQVETNELIVGFTSNFQLAWHDKGSGGNTNGSFWKPVAPAGYSLVGDYAQRGYVDPTGNAVVMVLKAKQNNALVAPSDFKLVWKDTGSGAGLDGSMWSLLCPSGYVSLGSVSQQGYGKPDANKYRCVKATLAPTGIAAEDVIWSDKGTGARTDFSAWGIQASTAQKGFANLAAGSFIAQASHAQPQNVSTLSIPVAPTLPASSPEKPQLSGFTRPSDFGQNVVKFETVLPWFAVKDTGLTDAQKIVQSPFYTLVRESKYKLIDHIDNQNGGADQSRQVRATVGTSQTAENNFSNTTGISVTVGYTPPALGGVNASVTLSNETTHGWSKSTEQNEANTIVTNLTAKKGTAEGVYEIMSTFTLYRQNQQQVGSPMSGGAGASVYYVTYPPSGV
ncbi:MAG: hypothetical protein ACI9WC_000437 [Arenicella sp.]|jgi:hypothetical protein